MREALLYRSELNPPAAHKPGTISGLPKTTPLSLRRRREKIFTTKIHGALATFPFFAGKGRLRNNKNNKHTDPNYYWMFASFFALPRVVELWVCWLVLWPAQRLKTKLTRHRIVEWPAWERGSRTSVLSLCLFATCPRVHGLARPWAGSPNGRAAARKKQMPLSF